MGFALYDALNHLRLPQSENCYNIHLWRLFFFLLQMNPGARADAGRGGLNLWPGFTWQALFWSFSPFHWLSQLLFFSLHKVEFMCGFLWRCLAGRQSTYAHIHALYSHTLRHTVNQIRWTKCCWKCYLISLMCFTWPHVMHGTWNMQTLSFPEQAVCMHEGVKLQQKEDGACQW